MSKKTNQINFKAFTPISQEKFKVFLESLANVYQASATVTIFSEEQAKHIAVKVKGKTLCLWV